MIENDCLIKIKNARAGSPGDTPETNFNNRLQLARFFELGGDFFHF